MTFYNAFELSSALSDEEIDEDAKVIIVDRFGVYMRAEHLYVHASGAPVVIVNMLPSMLVDSEIKTEVSQILRQLREDDKRGEYDATKPQQNLF